MSNKQYQQTGLASDVEIGKGGPRVKDSSPSGTVQARNNADNAFARVQGADSVVDDDLVTRRQLLASGGSLAGEQGGTYENLQFFMDPGDRNTYPGSGSSVTDLMGNATAGTLNGGMTYADGAFEGTDGGNGSITFTKDSDLDDIFDGGGTFICFLRPDEEGQVAGILADTSEGTTSAGWLCYFNTTGRLDFVVRRYFTGAQGEWQLQEVESRLNPVPDASGIDPVAPGAWVMLAIVYDSSSPSNDPAIWMNDREYTTANGGIVENDTPSGTPQSDAGNEITLGNRPANDRDFDGLIGPMLWFDRELSAAEMRQIFSLFGERFALGMRAAENSIGEGTPMILRAGGTTANNADGFGGPMYTAAGDSSSTNNTTSGGDRLDRAGDHSGAGKGGDYTSRAGDASGTGDGGAYTARAGDGDDGGDYLARGGDATGGNGGDYDSRGGHGSGAGSTGGDATYGGGDGDTAVANTNGGDTVINAGDGGNGGTPGTITQRSGETAGANGTTGSITSTTASEGVATSVAQTGNQTIETGPVSAGSLGSGDLNLTTGDATGGAAPSGDINLTTGDSDSTNAGGKTGDIRHRCGDATANDADAEGGSVGLHAGDAQGATAGTPGDIELEAGQGPAESGAIREWSHAGFTAARAETRTQGSVETVIAAATNVVATLGTLSANGDTMQFEVYVTAIDAADDNEVISFYQVVTAFRSASTVTLLSGHAGTAQQKNGTGSVLFMNFSIAPNVNDVELQLNNADVGPHTYRTSVRWTRMGGGQAA